MDLSLPILASICSAGRHGPCSGLARVLWELKTTSSSLCLADFGAPWCRLTSHCKRDLNFEVVMRLPPGWGGCNNRRFDPLSDVGEK